MTCCISVHQAGREGNIQAVDKTVVIRCSAGDASSYVICPQFPPETTQVLLL